MKPQKRTGLGIEIRGKRFILINKRGGYQEIDITPVFYFLKEFFLGKWKKKPKVKNKEKK